jgi:hypothetical protein
MATIETVRHTAGQLLGIVRHPEGLRAEHDELLTQAYNEVYDKLKEENLNEWSAAGPVPDRFVDPVAGLMAFKLTDRLGISGDRYARILARRNSAMTEIRTIATPPYNSTEEADYF